MTADDDPLGGNGSIEDRAAAGEGSEPEPELFPLGSLDGDAVTLKTLVKAGQKIESTVSMGTAEVPVRGGGLLDPAREGMVLVTYEVAKYEVVPTREGERHDGKKVVGHKIRQGLRPIYVERVEGEAGAIEASYAALAQADPTAAAALLDRLRARMTDVLGSASSNGAGKGAKATAAK